jgi:hypothetical protein
MVRTSLGWVGFKLNGHESLSQRAQPARPGRRLVPVRRTSRMPPPSSALLWRDSILRTAHRNKELITRLQARAANSNAAGRADALAWFDVGYLAEAYKQWMGKGEPNPASGFDGYSWVRKAISWRGSDPEMEFAAALITLRGSEGARQDHTRKAMAGAKSDPLLARNLGSGTITMKKPSANTHAS